MIDVDNAKKKNIIKILIKFNYMIKIKNTFIEYLDNMEIFLKV